MVRQKLEQIASGLQDFYSDYKMQLTQAERQAITKTVIALDLIAEVLPEEDSVLGNEMELEEGVVSCGVGRYERLWKVQ